MRLFLPPSSITCFLFLVAHIAANLWNSYVEKCVWPYAAGPPSLWKRICIFSAAFLIVLAVVAQIASSA